MMQKIETMVQPSGSGPSPRTLNLEALRSFIAICETGSFRRAAQRVNKSPSAVSLQIAKIEELLGTRLLDRDARHVALTEDGSTLLGQARRLLGVNDETIALFRKSPLVGHLCLAAPHDLGVSLVPRLLRRLADIHPDLHVDVRLGTTDFVKAGLADGTVNLGLFNDVAPATDSATQLYAEPLAWLVLTGGRAAEKTPLPLAVAEVRCAWREAALSALQAADRTYRVAYSSDTSMGQIAAVRADLAIAALPASMADRDVIEAPAHLGLPPLPMTSIHAATDGSDLAKTCVAVMATDMDQPMTLTSRQPRPKVAIR